MNQIKLSKLLECNVETLNNKEQETICQNLLDAQTFIQEESKKTSLDVDYADWLDGAYFEVLYRLSLLKNILKEKEKYELCR